MNTADILDKAADLIDVRGLAKKRHVDGKGCLCTAGAMFCAVGIEPVNDVFQTERWPTWNHASGETIRRVFNWFTEWLR